MTPARFHTVFANLPDDEERQVLIDMVLSALTLDEIVDAIMGVWARRDPDTHETVGERVSLAVAGYHAEAKQIDAEIAAEDAQAADDEGLA